MGKCVSKNRGEKELQPIDVEPVANARTARSVGNGPGPRRLTLLAEDLDRCLQVSDVYFRLSHNRRAHHTEEYESFQLIVRRGEPFQLCLAFDKPYTEENSQLTLEFHTGDSPKISDGTLARVPVDSPLGGTSWGAKVTDKGLKTIDLLVQAPPNAIVGKYSIVVETILDGHKYRTEKDPYSHIYMLFNPWCKDDSVYLNDEEQLQEYIMNESGIIYVGNKRQVMERPWNFGQFEMPVLDASLELLDKAKFPHRARWDPVRIVRVVSKMVNSQDEDGVLVGNWSGEYEDGIRPSAWNGSVEILQQYYDKKEPVCFGQCWVFSGVTTSVLRSLGIPARSVTNFASAHDTDGNLVVDIHYDEEFTPIDYLNTDSTWNFHVWNEAWMTRPDLPAGYGGWQAFDATPQETSEGQFRCGPASVHAIKNGHVYYGYDAKFIFAEVNADSISWVCPEDRPMYQVFQQKRGIGVKISTKAVGTDEREDITEHYKFSEGTEEERLAVEKAVSHGSRPHTYGERPEKADVEFSINAPKEVIVGHDFTASVTLRNHSNQERNVSMFLTAHTMYYTGVPVAQFHKEKFVVTLQPNGQMTLHAQIEPAQYMAYLVDQGAIKLNLLGRVRENKCTFAGQTDFRFSVPRLNIHIPARERSDFPVGEEFVVELSFKNPLAVKLTNTEFHIEGPGIQKPKCISYRDVRPLEAARTLVTMKPVRPGNRKIIANFQSKQLHDVQGHLEILVTEDEVIEE
ncbi:protein-glutamine gamma-glutamyltransferase K-like [Branchiostoma floridae x Branchiostoma belcheri]